jgi:hypothetical protein
MKTASYFTPSLSEQQIASSTKISLKQLVSRLMNNLVPLYVQRGNLVLNNIPSEMEITGDVNTLTFTLGNMISSAVTGTCNECIRIEAIPSKEFTVIRIKGRGPSNYHTIPHIKHEAQNKIARMSGRVSVAA